jgi:hypothetical protein
LPASNSDAAGARHQSRPNLYLGCLRDPDRAARDQVEHADQHLIALARARHDRDVAANKASWRAIVAAFAGVAPCDGNGRPV